MVQIKRCLIELQNEPILLPYFYTDWPEIHKKNMLLFMEPPFHKAHTDHTLCTGLHISAGLAKTN